MAVITSVDSVLDLLSGFILWFTTNAMRKPNQFHYPFGKRRMQPVICFFRFSLLTPLFAIYSDSSSTNLLVSQ